MGRPAGSPATLVLVGGHESADGADLAFLTEVLPGVVITAPGHRLHRVTSLAIAETDKPIVVLPITFGRNPTLVADTAKTLSWLSRGSSGRIALANDFGTIDHLTAWLRTAATAVRRASPGSAILITAPAANPFDDAELFRIAHLVRTHGAGNEVEVGVVRDDQDVALAIDRLRRLGSDEIVVVPASFQRRSTVTFGEREFAHARFYGPLMTEQSVLRVIRDRRDEAIHRLDHGQNGIDVGLQADHGHGYAHSHAFEAGQGHPHIHGGHEHEHGTLVHKH